MKWLLTILVMMFAAIAMAADVSGTWKGTVETPNGAIERTFVFKVDGSKLTGETSSEMMGKSTITDGKVEGDAISFSTTVKFQDNEMKLNYKGKVMGDQIKLSVDTGTGQTFEYSVKRIS